MKLVVLLLVLICVDSIFGRRKKKGGDRNDDDGKESRGGRGHGGGEQHRHGRGHSGGGGQGNGGSQILKWGWDDLREKLKCKSCTFDVDGTVEDVKNILSTEKLLPFKGITPCRKCSFLGAATITRSEESCTAPSLISKSCTLNILEFKINNLRVDCNCSLPTQPDILARLFDEASGTAKTAPCSFDAERGEAVNFRFKNFERKSAVTVPSCAPLATGVVPERKTAPAKTNGEWNNIMVTVMFGTCPKRNPQLWSMHILNENYDEIKSQCESDEGSDSCKCFQDGNMMQSIINHFIEKFLPCYINTKTEMLAGLKNKFVCE